MAVTAGSADAAMVLTGPAKGTREGAWRGMQIGFLAPIAGGIVLGLVLAPMAWWATPVYGLGFALAPAGAIAGGLALAPIGAVAGGAIGSATIDPTATVEEKEAVIRTALKELNIQQALRDCASSALREHAPHITLGSEGERPSTILEVTVEEFGLAGNTLLIDPPLRFVMTERTRMIRASDGGELYTHRLTWRGQFRPLDEWVAGATPLLKEEAGRACQGLAESLVDEVFLLYPTPDER